MYKYVSEFINKMLSCRELYAALTVFWVTYIGASMLFPDDKSIMRPKSRITRIDVIKRLVVNCFATIAMVPLISYIPQLIFFPDTILWRLVRFVLFPFISEIWFYYIHRLMHTKYFYKWHADHHAFIQSYALAGLYCSVVEMIFVNQLSVAIPYQILGLTMGEMMFGNILVAFSALRGHAGMYFRDDIPMWMSYLSKDMISSLDHDIHHRTMSSNYGVLYLLDRIHGTYKSDL